MLSKNNIKCLEDLEGSNFSYIVGARLKSMSSDLKDRILDESNYRKIKKEYFVAEIPDGDRRIIASYSAKRARKDARDRKRAIKKLMA